MLHLTGTWVFGTKEIIFEIEKMICKYAHPLDGLSVGLEIFFELG
jgi:hypothetical protein